MRRHQFKTHNVSDNLRKHWKKWLFRCVVCILVVLWTGGTLHAEIYKWQDETGTIRYSNKPPLDPSQIVEKIPTRRVPLVEDADGVVYYLNVPIENQEEEILSPEEITVSPEVLKEILKEAPAVAIQSTSQLPVDITALTVHLAEVENALTREIENRVKWEYEYTQAESFVRKLEKQNKTLRLTLARLEKDLGNLRGAVVVSDSQLTALKNSQHPQKLAMLEGKVDDIQSYINNIVQVSDQRVAKVQSEMDTLKTTQGTKLDTLSAKLEAVESELETINDLDLSDKLAALSTEVHNLKSQKQLAAPKNSLQPKQLAMLEGKVNDIQSYINDIVQTSDQHVAKVQTEINSLKTTQGTKLDTLNAKLDAVELELETINELALSDKLAALSTEVHSLKSQRQLAAPKNSLQPQQLAMLEGKMDDIQSYINDIVQTSDQRVAKVQTEINSLKTTQGTKLETLNTKLDALELELETINGLALFDKLADLSTEVNSLESQGKLDNDIRGRLASLETEVEQLIDALPVSREASDVEPVIDELMEKNSFMESVIKHQTNVLKAQNKQIQAIEAKLAQLQLPGQVPGEQKVAEHVADQVEMQILSELPSGGGIRIVPRKERVKPPEYFFMKWLRGDAEATDLCYPHSVIEKKEH